MILRFKGIDQEEQYSNWLKNVGGYVYNNFGGQNINYKKLHRSDCDYLNMRPNDLKTSVEKICCIDLIQLENWLKFNNLEFSYCKYCKPEIILNVYQNNKNVKSISNDWKAKGVVNTLIEYREKLKPQKSGGTWSKDKVSDQFLRENPFAFLMAASIDRGAKAESIWKIPYMLYRKVGHLNPSIFASMPTDQMEDIIRSLPIKPRYPRQSAETIIELSNLVVNKYHGNTKEIWANKEPNEILMVLLSVKGIGTGIANMIIRILVDEFDYYPGKEGYKQIDIKPDVHVIRVFFRTGLVNKKDSKSCVETARILNPDYPGLLDWPAWEIGRTWCDENRPKCNDCPLDNVCLHRY